MNATTPNGSNLHPNPQNCKLRIRDSFFSRYSYGLNSMQAHRPLQQAEDVASRTLSQVNRGLEKIHYTGFPIGHRIKGLSFPGSN